MRLFRNVWIRETIGVGPERVESGREVESDWEEWNRIGMELADLRHPQAVCLR